MAQHYRALFISDVHLGTPWTEADRLLEWLGHVHADTIYLVGDIVDFWRIRRGVVWPPSHSAVLGALLGKAHSGTRVVFIPGNHEDGLKRYCGTKFGEIEIERSVVHTTAAGKRYLVVHGDDYDFVARHARWLAHVGDRSYAAALGFNRLFNACRRALGKEYWSISAYLKHKVKACVSRAGHFEAALAAAASAHDATGVICGHIHHPDSRMLGAIHYVNIGDWVESCTAVVETAAGNLELISLAKEHAPASAVPGAVAASRASA
jgi:UDP-2,3-diacylglucosamine pyrophosphatase LpxH